MPQKFQILRCFSCEKFQVHQTKKANKWQCKVCGEKQSLKKAYFVGAARDCRTNVQQLNFEDGKRKLDSMLAQNNECSEEMEENSFFESITEEDMKCFDECGSVNQSLQKSPVDALDVCVDNQRTLWMPKKKQRYEQNPLIAICNKDVSITSMDKNKTCETDQNIHENLDIPLYEQSVSFDVFFGEHSSSSKTNDVSENTCVSSDLKIGNKFCLSYTQEQPSKRAVVSKNRGFQLIMNAAKKLSVDVDF